MKNALISLCFCLITHAQEYTKDTIFLNSGDTIACKIVSSNNGKIIYLIGENQFNSLEQNQVNYFIQKSKTILTQNITPNSTSDRLNILHNNLNESGYYWRKSFNQGITSVLITLTGYTIGVLKLRSNIIHQENYDSSPQIIFACTAIISVSFTISSFINNYKSHNSLYKDF